MPRSAPVGQPCTLIRFFLQKGGSGARAGNDGTGGVWVVADTRDPDFGKASALRSGVINPETEIPFAPVPWTHDPEAQARSAIHGRFFLGITCWSTALVAHCCCGTRRAPWTISLQSTLPTPFKTDESTCAALSVALSLNPNTDGSHSSRGRLLFVPSK